MPEPFWLLVYVRVESRTFYHLHPCLCSSGVENPPPLYSLFMYQPTWLHVYVRAESRTFLLGMRSRELYVALPIDHFTSSINQPKLSARCQNKTNSKSLLMYQPTWHHVYVRAESRTFYHLHPCLCSSGVENPPSLYSLFMFERSREPSFTLLLVYVQAYLTPCLCSSGVENFLPLAFLFMFERSRELFC
jgi:hypothetical protein